jgi:hypothetical protein
MVFIASRAALDASRERSAAGDVEPLERQS